MTLSASIEVLENIKEKLIEKQENAAGEDRSLKEEISALRYITRFINIIFKSFPKGFIKKIIKEDNIRNSTLSKEILDKYYEHTDMILERHEDETIEYLYATDIRLLPNHKLKFSIIRYKEGTYILLEPQKYSRGVLHYINWENFNFPVDIIKENRKIIKEMNNKK